MIYEENRNNRLPSLFRRNNRCWFQAIPDLQDLVHVLSHAMFIFRSRLPELPSEHVCDVKSFWNIEMSADRELEGDYKITGLSDFNCMAQLFGKLSEILIIWWISVFRSTDISVNILGERVFTFSFFVGGIFTFLDHQILYLARLSFSSRSFNPDAWATRHTVFTTSV